MKRFALICLSALLAVSMAAKNKAILIGVSNYPDGSGWCKLNAHNDVVLLKSLLEADWDISVLENSKATHKGIVSTLIHVSHIVCPGDTVLVHFSGHGQQMLPIQVDSQTDPDMLDEAIIPFDANKEWSSNYDGSNHLRDNEFGTLIDDIRDRVGLTGLVVVVLDACHSDSMQKGLDTEMSQIYRGTSDIFGQNVLPEDEKKRFLRDTSIIAIHNNSEVVYISACQSHSKNAEIITPEGGRYGSLSYAVAGALGEGGLKDLKSFLDHVIISMDTLVKYQNPGVRASFEYQKPNLSQKQEQAQIYVGKADKHIGVITIFIIIIAISCIIIWWKKEKWREM